MLRLTRILALAALAATTAVVLAAQRPPSNSAAAGEWRYYGGDSASTKYSPLGQITRANVNQLQIAWRWSSPDNEIAKANPVARPAGYQDTPIMVNGVLYTTTSLGIYVAIDPATGRTLWQYDPEIWKLGRPPNLGFTHRGTAYWTDGRAAPSHQRHARRASRLDRRRNGEARPELSGRTAAWMSQRASSTSERGRNYAINSTPVIVKNVIIAGANIQDLPQTKEQPRGDIFGFDAGNREEALDLPFDSAERRIRVRELGRWIGGVHRRHECLVDAHRRRGARLRLPAVRHADQRLLRRPSARRQPVCRKPRLSRRQDRQTGLAFPGRPSWTLGLRLSDGADSRGHHGQRAAHQCRRAGQQAGVRLCVRSTNRRARLADRGAAGAAVERAGRAHGENAAVSDEAAALRSPEHARR